VTKAGSCSLLLLTVCLVAPGCSDPGGVIRVRGVVLYKGNPLRNGAVYFTPVDAARGKPASCPIGKDGSFIPITGQDSKGLVPGEYRVSVWSFKTGSDGKILDDPEKTPGGGLAISRKFTDGATSGLSIAVTEADTNKVYTLELTD
jgi:hypothetical protein